MPFAVHDWTGRPTGRRYATKEEALTAARRAYKRRGGPFEVVWYNHDAVPKVWLAFVDANGAVTKTVFWEGSTGGDGQQS